MKNYKFCFIFFYLIVCQFVFSQKTTAYANNSQDYVVVLSLDGFRWDYTDMVETPNFDSIAKVGVKAEDLRPSFPSKTFPNHYSIATGLYPGDHGLVNNSFYDPDKKETYKVSDRSTVEDPDFYGGEPIWNTAEKQGVKAACFYWVGSEAPVQGMRPSIWKKYDQNFDWDARIDSVIYWLQLPEAKRPHLIMWYLPEPDGTGHKYGPHSEEIKAMVKKLDTYVGKFMSRLRELPNGDKINFVITSDHGMGEISSKRQVNLKKYINSKDIDYDLEGNPVVFLQPKKGKLNKVYNELKNVEHINVTKKGERPDDWHYNNNKRISDLVIVADSSWSVFFGAKNGSWVGGTHGYDPKNKDMHAIFYAYGPAFKHHFIQPSFENVDIYNVLAHILKLKPASNDGDFDRVKGMLEE